jgi:hypothetical protein
LKATEFDANGRRNDMNRIKAIAIVAIANSVMAASSFAQNHMVQANIPFDFTVSGKLFPAGEYRIEQRGTNIVEIRNHDKPISAVAMVAPDGNAGPGGGKITFHRYGDQYFLSQILSDSAGMSFKVPVSKKERATQLQEARVTPSTTTFVAAR